jgi:glycosyltransferase involved in cell wall biosynthesis
MRHAALVVAGNDYLKEKAVRAGAKEVVIIPTVIDVEKYQPKKLKETAKFVIGWIGSPITAKYLPFLKDVFLDLAREHSIEVKLIGAGNELGIGEIEKVLPWREEEEIAEISSFDVGIMPLEDNIWERGKCGYKLIQYMGCGLPVIGSPLGVNRTIIRPSWNGFQATTKQEWKAAFEKLLTNPELRRELGMNGRQLVENDYSLQRYQRVWLEVLSRVGKNEKEDKR